MFWPCRRPTRQRSSHASAAPSRTPWTSFPAQYPLAVSKRERQHTCISLVDLRWCIFKSRLVASPRSPNPTLNLLSQSFASGQKHRSCNDKRLLQSSAPVCTPCSRRYYHHLINQYVTHIFKLLFVSGGLPRSATHQPSSHLQPYSHFYCIVIAFFCCCHCEENFLCFRLPLAGCASHPRSSGRRVPRHREPLLLCPASDTCEFDV